MPEQEAKPQLPLEGIPGSVCAKLYAAGHHTSYPASTPVLYHGQEQDHLFYLVSGLIAVENIYAGRIFEVGEIEEGTFFGEIGFFTDHTSTASLIAHTDCAVWSISKEEFTGFLDANPVSSRAILYYFLGIISTRLRQVYREADEQTDEQGGAH